MNAVLAPPVHRTKQRDYLSYSQLALYRQCPLRWHFKYVQGLPERFVSSALVFGGAVHRALEFHYRELLCGNPAPDRDLLLAEFWDEWQTRERQHGVIRFARGQSVNDIGKLADRVLGAFQVSEHAIPDGTILGVEEQLRGQVVEGCPDLLAKLDLIFDAGDALSVVDLKTAASRWNETQAQNSSEQLLLYGELARTLVLCPI